jgi:beta-xylosidase
VSDLPNPIIPGFSPDPSVVRVGDAFYIVTSTFEYLPGLPVYRSTDLVTWDLIGNVAIREEQLGIAEAPSGLGVWAPTIRHHDGLFHVIVAIAAGDRGCVVFTAEDPAGPWSDGITIVGVGGIDPDLAWDEDGTAYVTYSGLILTGAEMGKHLGVQQVRVDLAAGTVLEEPRSLWSGTGLQFPEAPHVYRRGDDWYLMIAEGGTERGHGVSIARGPSITGPFTGAPTNPVLSARSTGRLVQSTGHADLTTAPDGTDVLVLLGLRVLGGTRAFSPLGREPFITPVVWDDEGWPHPEPIEAAPGPGVDEVWAFDGPHALADPGWLAVRRAPEEIGSLTETPGRLTLHGDPAGFRGTHPVFVGRRQRHIVSVASTVVDASAGAGGLGFRMDETCFVALEARGNTMGTTVTATAAIPSIVQTWTADLPAGPVELRIDTRRPGAGFSPDAMGGDRIRLIAAAGGTEVELTELDGRYWTAETAASFTGRVVGPFATDGVVAFEVFRYRGDDRVQS